MPRVVLGLGSNIDPEENLRAVAVMLRARWPAIRFSSVYRTAPVGKTNQQDFLNAVAVVETDEPPTAILNTLQGIERALGKHVTERFGPRTIDLDLLLYGDETIHEPGLEVPHPRMHERRFVLEPLRELIPGHTQHPSLEKTWDAYGESAKEQTCERERDRRL